MSEARHQRFELDINEIERQLREAVETAPASRPDPLAELARIVGQDDPFRGILGDSRRPAASHVHASAREPAAASYELVAPSREGAVRQGPGDDLFDPVAEAYGSPDAAFGEEDLQPLRPHRSRGRLMAVAAALLLSVGAVAGGLYWRKAGSSFSVAGLPPLVTADTTPLKVTPENPGGVEVPNQNKQIYERRTPETQSRVVDRREQPVDVREFARNLPPPPTVPPLVVPPTADTPSATSRTSADGTGPRGAGGSTAGGSSKGNAVSSILGEPRRVRTVSVRPDGSIYVPSGASAVMTDATPTLFPGGSLPPPVAVPTVAVPARGAASADPATPPAPVSPVPVMAMPQASESAAAASRTAPVDAGEPPAGASAVQVLPPRRPRGLSDSDEAPVRTASLSNDQAAPAGEKPAGNTGRPGNFAVQIAVRSTEGEARTAYSELQERYAANLDGRPASVNTAEVNGKTVYRVRVGPMSKDDANGLCTKLKASGGKCFVAAN